jgi:hypothetical protein
MCECECVQGESRCVYVSVCRAIGDSVNVSVCMLGETRCVNVSVCRVRADSVNVSVCRGRADV